MSSSNCSAISKISKTLLFFTLFILIFSFISKEKSDVNNYRKNLRQLSDEMALFTIFKVFDWFFFFFFAVSFCCAPCLYFITEEDPQNDSIAKTFSFFVNKIFYIIDIGYLITSAINFINDVEYKYSLAVFICALILFIMHSIIYIVFSVNFEERCFPGICQWEYLKVMLTAPCCFFAPCREEECKEICKSEENCCNCYTCLASICACFLYITNVIIYYFGLIFYTLSWLIGKFFVFISCCDCWCKEEYDMNSFNFSKTSNTPLVIPETNVDKEVKKQLDKLIPKEQKDQIKKLSNNFIIQIEKTIKISYKVEKSKK